MIDRAKRLLNSTAHQNIGAYTNSRGLQTVRQYVAQYLKERDGFAANPDHIFLTNGASSGIGYAMQCLIASQNDGILLPIPQYPLYSATITLNNGQAVNYYLDESDDWNASLQSIESAIAEATKKGINIKAISVINPGNPTGQCMTKQCIDGIIEIAAKYRLVILADEVYQENIYYADEFPFVSFRKCLLSSPTFKSSVELISFHSVSKGIFGECGLRGGYFELNNIEQSGVDMLVKLASINLCPNTIGQCMVDMMVNPPKNGDESYELFKHEYEKQFGSLQERAKILTQVLNSIDGMSCNTVYGAMYAFPNIVIPEEVIENVCKAYPIYKGKSIDYIYCMELLENYGICVIPGSGFGQKNGSYHLRTTILPPKEQIQEVAKSLEEFHRVFIETYSSIDLK